ncbi:slipin family protein [Ovoidimarina sediminis]|uniref:slipin family protein n=1 Tax=Ovoidimarina sediminis TaxID=3079856 RepID=UPI00290F7BE6|nr:slipin family protein [Rhodophyticola sp. MJ-SS7]MDU8942408.1 slipin family protein [Rhodophyticola sp. MJ-SS7]
MSGGLVSFLGILAVLALGILLLRYGLGRQTIWAWQRGLHYRNGRFERVLEPGAYWINKLSDHVVRIDVRQRSLVLSGQEILTKDRVAVKVSLSFFLNVSDPKQSHEAVMNALYDLEERARLALRDAVFGMTLDEVMEDREVIPAAVEQALAPVAETMGYALSTVALRDVMLPSNLKRAYAGVLEAQKDAERRLEAARGEQAVLRSLANTARMIEGNPALMKLRLLQAAEGGGNAIHFEMGGVPEAGDAKE